VFNEDSDNFIKSLAEWQSIPGSIDAMVRLSKTGFTIAVATNQSGINRGLFDLDELEAMHARLTDLLIDQDFLLPAYAGRKLQLPQTEKRFHRCD